MYINKKINKENFFLFLIFIIFISIGFSSFKDYGVSIDEEIHLSNGEQYYNFFLGLFNNDPNFISTNELKIKYSHRHGQDPVVFDFSVIFLADLLNLNEKQKIYHLKHLMNYSIFLIGSFYFFLILRKRFDNFFLIIVGLLFLVLSPRIFSNSFYNNKDLIFLSVSCIFFYYSINFFNKPGIKTALIFAIITSLVFDIRIFSIIYIFVFYLMFFFSYLDKDQFLKSKLKFFPIIFFVTTLFIYILWPYLWIDPINNLINYFVTTKEVTPSMQNLYFGEYIYSKSLPWHYEIVWILFTSPLLITIFFIIGYFKMIKTFSLNLLHSDEKNHKFWTDHKQFIDFYFFCALTLSFFIKLKFGVSYNGWRQIYYLYPIIIYFSLCGVEFLIKKLNKKTYHRVIAFFFIIELAFLSFWNYKNHPNQFVFFHPIFKTFTFENFDLDYWGVSHKQALEKILEITDEKSINIIAISYTNLNDSLRVLQKNQQKKFKIVDSINKADFVIDNYMRKWSYTPGEENLKENFKVVYNLIVDGNKINTVYKRNK